MKIQTFCLLLILFIALCVPGYSVGSEGSHRAAIEEMLRLSKVDEMMEPMFDQIEGMLKNQFMQMSVTEEQLPILEKYQKELFNLMKEEMAWSKMRDDFVDIYARVYTEEEILEINKFYSSPAGRKMIEKMPLLMQETMTITQKNMQSLLPKVQEITKKMAEEVRASSPAQ